MRLWHNMPKLNHQIMNKQDIARSFSRAANTYDGYAALQQKVGDQLFKSMPSKASRVLDLGCGTGFFTHKIRQKYEASHIVGLDLAQGMIDYCHHHQPNIAEWVCGDAENLPFEDSSFDVIFSSLAIQWCHDFSRVLVEAKRVLKPGGVFLFSTLGPKTLFELRDAWSKVDDYQHVNQFVAIKTLQQKVINGGFSETQWQVKYEIQTYQAVKELTTELKKLGAHNVTQGRNTQLTGRQRIQLLQSAYEAHRHNGRLPATYEVVYGVLIK